MITADDDGASGDPQRITAIVLRAEEFSIPLFRSLMMRVLRARREGQNATTRGGALYASPEPTRRCPNARRAREASAVPSWPGTRTYPHPVWQPAASGLAARSPKAVSRESPGPRREGSRRRNRSHCRLTRRSRPRRSRPERAPSAAHPRGLRARICWLLMRRGHGGYAGLLGSMSPRRGNHQTPQGVGASVLVRTRARSPPSRFRPQGQQGVAGRADQSVEFLPGRQFGRSERELRNKIGGGHTDRNDGRVAGGTARAAGLRGRLRRTPEATIGSSTAAPLPARNSPA